MNLKYSKFTFSQFQKDFIWSNFEILEIHLNFDLRIFLYCFKFMQKIESLAFGLCLSITLKLKLVDLLLDIFLFLDTLWLLAMSQIIQSNVFMLTSVFDFLWCKITRKHIKSILRSIPIFFLSNIKTLMLLYII